MTPTDRGGPDDVPLNPALKSASETGTDTSRTAAPLETVSVPEHQRSSWPAIWLITLLLCVVLTVYLLFG